MNMKNNFRIIALVALIISIYSCTKDSPYVDKDYKPYVPQTPVGKQLMSTYSEVGRIFRDTTFLVTVGVEETDMSIQTMSGYIQQLYLIRVDTKVAGIRLAVALPDNSSESQGWKEVVPSTMAKNMDAPGARVAAIVNGDFWNTTRPINPRGPVHVNGTIVHDKWDYGGPNSVYKEQALSFMAVTDDGEFIIAPREEYSAMKSTLKECTGAGFMMLVNGQHPETDWTARDPRTAIGYTEDGVIWLLTCDGRMTFSASGMTYKEMGYIFRALGCKNAANLDGGRSAQMLIRHPIADVWQVRNRPAAGQERPVVNCWAVLVDEP